MEVGVWRKAKEVGMGGVWVVPCMVGAYATSCLTPNAYARRCHEVPHIHSEGSLLTNPLKW